MSTLTPRPSHHHPTTEPDDQEPGLLPVEPDLGPVPIALPDESAGEGATDNQV